MTKVRLGDHPSKTRFVIETTEAIPYRVFLLSDPYRVVIDLPNVVWRAPMRPLNAPIGVISNYRFGLFRPGNSRVVIDVTRPVLVVHHAILVSNQKEPNRFFVDLKIVDPATFEKNRSVIIERGWKPPVTAKKPVPAITENKISGRHVIVIDPGHGGVDPGAIGQRGTLESRVTLSAARSVKRTLEKSGRYEVILTRNRDVYIPLRDRFAKAEQVKSELFISLHADSIKNRKLRGASVYTLSEKASDIEAETLANKENRSDIIAGVDLTTKSDTVASVLISLRQRHTMDESAHFARFMVKHLGSSIKLLRNTHRFAGFAVLKSPDVPSVLIELGYLSNRQDETMLRSKSFHTKTSKAILRAIDIYFKRKKRLSRP